MIFKNEETNIQVAVIDYLRNKYPNTLFTIAPSGMKLPIYVAKMLKAMGYTAGTPDIMIFEPRQNNIIVNSGTMKCIYHGLFLEMKTHKGNLSELQEWFLHNLEARSYVVAVCFGYDSAIKVIDKYMALEIPDQRFFGPVDRGFE